MPLFTYIACYRGSTHADQDRRSNFKGFASLVIGRIPDNALPGLNKALRNSAVKKIMAVEWQPVPNRTNVWRTSFDLDGSDFAIYAVQTQT
jgi:hypothetical protein